jgi:hypothetical protein
MAGGHAPWVIASKRMDLVKAFYEHRQSKGSILAPFWNEDIARFADENQTAVGESFLALESVLRSADFSVLSPTRSQ